MSAPHPDRHLARRLLGCCLLGCCLLGACSYTTLRGAIPLAIGAGSLRSVGAFSPDGGRFAVVEATLGGGPAERSHLRVFERGPTPDLPGQWRLSVSLRLQDLFAVDVAFSADGRFVAVAGHGRPHSVALWDLRRRRLVRAFPGSAALTQTVAFGPGAAWLLTAGIDGRLRVWDVGTGRLRAVVRDAPQLPRQSRFPVVVEPGGAFVAYPRTDGRVAFAEPEGGALLETRATGGREIYDLALSTDGRWLAAASDAGVTLWDLRDPRRRAQRLDPERVPALAFFPDSRSLLLAAEAPRPSRVISLPAGRVLYAFAQASAPARNVPLGGPFAAPASPEERRLWLRMRGTFRGAEHTPGLWALFLAYVRAPSIHRVAISPENLWVAFFVGGRGALAITRSHYELRRRAGENRGLPAPPPRPPLTPAERRRLQESI